MKLMDSLARRVLFHGLKDWREGRLNIELPNGHTATFGPNDGRPAVELWVPDERLFRKALLGGTIGIGESYMAGEWSSPTLPDLIARFLLHDRRRTLDTVWAWP